MPPPPHSRPDVGPISASDSGNALPPLPFDLVLWQQIVQCARLSPRLALAVELLLRGFCNKQIADRMEISISTLDTYWERIKSRTGARSRDAILRWVLRISHQLRDRAEMS